MSAEGGVDPWDSQGGLVLTVEDLNDIGNLINLVVFTQGPVNPVRGPTELSRLKRLKGRINAERERRFLASHLPPAGSQQAEDVWENLGEDREGE